MSIDLNRLSAKELQALINQAKKRKTTLDKRKPIAAVRSKLTKLAAAEGYSVAELFGGAATKVATRSPPRAARSPRTATTKGRKLGKVAPKYRNPDNGTETWSGRGKQPKWLAALTAQGRDMREFAIHK
ncbi:MAG: H-NS histone family protein [Luteimonas sp.]